MPHLTLGRPTVDDVTRISAMTAPVERNLAITQCYYDLSTALTEVFGRVANWCTFAVWASRQAGCTIRKEDLTNKIEEELARQKEVGLLIQAIAAQVVAHHPLESAQIEQRIRAFLIQEGSLERASQAVAQGNLKVFAEIGYEFARFLAEFTDPVRRTTDNVARFTTNAPPLLREAFTTYVEALRMTDSAERAQAILLANLLVGFHEQRRLQDQIRAALDCAAPDLELIRKRVLKALLPGWWRRIRHKVALALGIKLPLDSMLDELIRKVSLAIRQAVTREMMELRLPSGVLELGQDLSAPYPPALQTLRYPPLLAFMRIANPGGDVIERGPHDWSDFAYRMHYIARLFRSYQDDPQLLTKPFVMTPTS